MILIARNNTLYPKSYLSRVLVTRRGVPIPDKFRSRKTTSPNKATVVNAVHRFTVYHQSNNEEKSSRKDGRWLSLLIGRRRQKQHRRESTKKGKKHCSTYKRNRINKKKEETANHCVRNRAARTCTPLFDRDSLRSCN